MKLALVVLLSLLLRVKGQDAQLRYSQLLSVNKDAVNEAQDNFSVSKSSAIAELEALRNVKRNIMQHIPEFKRAMGEDIFQERYYDTFSQMINVAQKVREADPFVGKTLSDAISVVESQVTEMFNECVNSEVTPYLNKLAISIPQRISGIMKDEVDFKTSLAHCATSFIARSGTTQQCIQTVLQSNPYPSLNDTGLQTIGAMNTITSCVAKADVASQTYGDAGLSILRRGAPQAFQSSIPEKFAISSTPPIATFSRDQLQVPAAVSNKLVEVKASIAKAEALQAEASAAKAMDFQSALDYLQPQTKLLEDYIRANESFASGPEQPCYATAQAFLHAGPRRKAINLLQCISTLGQVATSQSITALHVAARDMEASEKALASAVECAKQKRNLLNSKNFQTCVNTRTEATVTKLEALVLEGTSLAMDGADFVLQVEMCKMEATIALARKTRQELSSLGSCLTKVTKVRVEVPQQCTAVAQSV